MRLSVNLALLTALAMTLVVLLYTRGLFTRHASSLVSDHGASPAITRTAIFFAYNEATDQDASSLSYFLDAAVWFTKEVDYFIVVNGDKNSHSNHTKLGLKNVKLIQRANSGYDFAAYHYALSSIVLSDYRYFIFLNSGVRGPLLPKYQLNRIERWPLIFTSMLNDKVKLVGPTISCEVQVHLQSHMFAMDYDGLMTTWNAGVFEPTSRSFHDLIIHSEMGLTDAVMQNGYTIDSLLTQYSGKDWRALWNQSDKGAGACNNGKNPTVENFYGTAVQGQQYSVPQLEVVFSKRGGTVHKVCKMEVNGEKVCNYDAMIDDTCEWTRRWLALE